MRDEGRFAARMVRFVAGALPVPLGPPDLSGSDERRRWA